MASPTPSPTPSPSPPPLPPPVVYTLTTKPTKNPSPQPAMSKQPQDPPPPQGVSGLGFIPKTFRPAQSADQLVTVANPGGFGPRSVGARTLGFPPPDPQVHAARPPILQASQPGSRFMGAAASKVAPFPPSSSEFNGLRDINRDDTVVTVHDRKVRLSDGTSLYALSRSWVRNGLPKETQTQIDNGVKLLPRPLPSAMTDTDTLEKSESGDEEEEGDKDIEEDEGFVEHLSSHALLQRHVNRAKRVRARLRKERLLRIDRYKQRLALLLPSSAEHFRNDLASGS